jgi:hypothetical protein
MRNGKLAVSLVSVLILGLAVAVASADDISNNLDASVDAVAESMPLAQNGATGTTNLVVIARNGDGKNGCNLTASSTLGVSVQSSNTSVATVSPSSITFNSCGDTPTLTVTPHTAGTATITVTQVSNTTGATFNFAPATFTVTVSPPPNTPPQISVNGVNAGASYNKGSVPAATCAVTDAEDGNSSFAATLGAVTGPNAADGIGNQTASCSYTDAGGLTASASKTYSIVDPSGPAISHTLVPSSPDGENGWYVSNVSLSWTVTDLESPLSILKAGCVDQNITADQAATSYSCSATSAGGSAGPDTVSIKRDATKPAVTRHAVADDCDTPGDNGWCRGTKTVGFSASDATSGLVDSLGAPLSSPHDFTKTRSTDGKDVSISSGTIKDAAGNQADAIDAQHIDIDGTKPVITRDASADGCDTPGNNGWCRGTKTVGFSASDLTSGLVNGTGDPLSSPFAFTKTRSTDGKDVSISSGTIKDAAGNEADAIDAEHLDIDGTKPVITRRAAADSCDTPGDDGWCRGTQSAGFSASDATSGLVDNVGNPLTSPFDFTKTSNVDGADVSISSGTIDDAAGNSADAIDAEHFKIDGTKPVITRDTSADQCDNPGNNGWCRGTATVGFSASDLTSGLVDGNGDPLSSPFSFTKSRSTDGADVSVSSGTIKDAAGNEADAVDAQHLNIDGTKPVITRDPSADSCDTPGDEGWCRGIQTAGFTASDATAGLVDGVGNPLSSPHAFTKSTGTNGSAVQISSSTIDDAAGNTADAVDAGPFKVDSVAPTQPSASTSPTSPAYGGWFKDSVTVSFGGSSDDTSGVASYSSDQTFNVSGSHGYSGTAKDHAGNVSDAVSGSVKVDATKPQVTLTCPTGLVPQGSVASASWTATDGESGVAGAASGSIALDTSSIGAKTATAPAGTASDNVGHGSNAATCTYNVIYNWDGFYSPVNNLPTWNVAKAGSAVPVKFSLDGRPLPGSNTSGQGTESSIMSPGSPGSQKVTCDNVAALDIVEETSTAGMSGLTYDPLADQWVYVWKTDKAYAGTCRQLVVSLADGTVHRANFKFTK